MNGIWLLLLVVLLVVNGLASLRVIRNGSLSAWQRHAQLAIVWCAPLVGAIVCLAFASTDSVREGDVLDRTGFVESGAAEAIEWDVPPGGGLCGCGGADGGGDGGD